jgi:hypothetical protein
LANAGGDLQIYLRAKGGKAKDERVIDGFIYGIAGRSAEGATLL